jgi:hypothetical protein
MILRCLTGSEVYDAGIRPTATAEQFIPGLLYTKWFNVGIAGTPELTNKVFSWFRITPFDDIDRNLHVQKAISMLADIENSAKKQSPLQSTTTRPKESNDDDSDTENDSIYEPKVKQEKTKKRKPTKTVNKLKRKARCRS